MKYLLDTNICVYWLNGKEEIKDKILELDNAEYAISIITLAEIKYGAYNSAKVQMNLQRVENFEETVNLLSLCKRSIEEYAKIKSELKAKGKILDDFDILIAATAIVNDYILVTNNTKHFSRIPGIKLENWVN